MTHINRISRTYRIGALSVAMVAGILSPGSAQTTTASDPARQPSPSCTRAGALATGTVLEREDDLIVIDLGADHGIDHDATIAVYDVVDENTFRIGLATVVRFGARLSEPTLDPMPRRDGAEQAQARSLIERATRQRSAIATLVHTKCCAAGRRFALTVYWSSWPSTSSPSQSGRSRLRRRFHLDSQR